MAEESVRDAIEQNAKAEAYAERGAEPGWAIAYGIIRAAVALEAIVVELQGMRAETLAMYAQDRQG